MFLKKNTLINRAWHDVSKRKKNISPLINVFKRLIDSLKLFKMDRRIIKKNHFCCFGVFSSSYTHISRMFPYWMIKNVRQNSAYME